MNDIDNFYSTIDDFLQKKTKNQVPPILKNYKSFPQPIYLALKTCLPYYYSYKNKQRIKEYKSRGIDYNEFLQGVFRYENEFRELYDILGDEKSKKTLLSILKYRISGDFTYFHQESDYLIMQYFDRIISLSDSEVFVDCGGFIGDASAKFISSVRNFKKIYFYEPELENYSKAFQYFNDWYGDLLKSKIVLRNCGVGEKASFLNFNANSDSSYFSSNVSGSGVTIPVVSLDEDISDKITYLKMDVEGFEIPALKGAKQHIQSEKPKLAISGYHLPNDLWEIPKLILDINSDYTMYLRQYDAGYQPFESLFYAI